ncbi:MAG: phage minor capsid protein [Clostridia bacterium]
MSNEYDIGKAFQRIEETLIKSMKRNLTRHLNEEKLEDMNWSAWQTEQLKSLEQFKRNNKQLFKNDFSTINTDIQELIKKSYENGKLEQEKVILEAIQEGNFSSNNKQINKLWHIYKTSKNNRIKKKQLTRIYDLVNQTESTFFKINERKLKALIGETLDNFEKAEMSILRYTNDQYRKVIYQAQVYANTGAGTVQQAVDMATKDFLSKGINNIEYANGAMVNIASYAEMAIRTANKRAYLQGEGTKRAEWGVHTVLVPNRGGGCPYCIKFQGKVFIDDVWSGGTEAESKETDYPLLSSAIKQKLFHPNCKDTTVTYFPGISTKPIPPTREQLEIKKQNYIKQQKLNYIENNIKKYSRLELGSIDNEEIEKYHDKRIAWQSYKERFKNNNQATFYDN